MNRVELKKFAKETIKGRLWNYWKMYLLVLLVNMGINLLFSDGGTKYGFVNVIIQIISFPLTLGSIKYTIKYIKKENLDIQYLFDYYKEFVPIMLLGLLTTLFISLGYVFLIIPGIIVGLGLSLVYYIYYFNPKKEAFEIIKESWNTMKGHKWECFVLGLSFFGWFLLGIFTLGILYIWLIPYMQATFTKYYLTLMKKD